MGVKKSHQWRKLYHALILNTMITQFRLAAGDYQYCDCSLIPESLVKWNKTLVMFGGTIWRTFRSMTAISSAVDPLPCDRLQV